MSPFPPYPPILSCDYHTGTDANVTLQMFGEFNGKKYQSPKLPLENSAGEHCFPLFTQSPLVLAFAIPNHFPQPERCVRGGKTVLLPYPHSNAPDNFERGMTDTFEVEATVGDIKYIVIGHDNSGFGPTWHLQEVIISSPSIPDLQFVANRCACNLLCLDKEGDCNI